MPQTRKDKLALLIQRSALLAEDRKKQLITVLDTLEDDQLDDLEEFLESEQKIIDQIIEDSITKAVEEGDTELLGELDTFLKTNTKTLRKAKEETERTDEEALLDEFFDEAT